MSTSHLEHEQLMRPESSSSTELDHKAFPLGFDKRDRTASDEIARRDVPSCSAGSTTRAARY